MNFQTQHLATLAKYAGISFIAGAVNHGMFSEQRSFLTAALGVVFYLIGAAMELKATNDGSKSWADLLGLASLHRSAWAFSPAACSISRIRPSAVCGWFHWASF
jgi:hypothetical protein